MACLQKIRGIVVRLEREEPICSGRVRDSTHPRQHSFDSRSPRVYCDRVRSKGARGFARRAKPTVISH